MKTKHIFITGGVVSGLGKGITASSLGRLLKNRGYKVVNQKFDPYLNVDPGNMDPKEHGEVFVTDDGAETDLDLGHYERFTDVPLKRVSSVSSGQIYKSVLDKERKGVYGGKTVQVIPHVTNEIKEKVYSFDEEVDIVITELGGTVGDIESLSFLEAIRQVSMENDRDDVLFIHVTLLPYISGSCELKSKPTQHSVKELQSLGIKPDILVCRSEIEIPEEIREKLALFCNVRKENVIQNLTAGNLYEVPLMLEKEGLAVSVCKHLRLDNIEPQNEEWEKMIERIKNLKNEVNIGIVGQYMQLHDSYLSVVESLKHGGYENDVKINIGYINAKEIKKENVEKIISTYDGIIMPDGVGTKASNGEIEVIKYVRENNIPFFGICTGMKMAVIEYLKNVLGKDIEYKSEKGNMRLGKYACILKENSRIAKAYEEKEIDERHRHKYEFDNEYREELEKNGLICSGISPDGNLVEAVEIPKNKFFVAVQFHPEYKSRPNKAAPLFREFIKESIR